MAKTAGTASTGGYQGAGFGWPQGLAFYLCAILGTGAIALPALAYTSAGPASLLAWGLLVVASVPIAATFAALGRSLPDAGGVSTYVRRAFGPAAATVSGWCFYFTIPIGVPASAYFAGNYVAAAAGAGHGMATAVTAVIVVAVLAANAAGIHVSATVQLAMAAVIVVMLGAAILLALPHVDAGNLEPFAPHGLPGVAGAVALIVWAFAGWEAMTYLGGEFRNPRRDLPLVTVLALAIVSVLYLGLAAVTVLSLSPADAGSKDPLTDLLAFGLGSAAPAVTTVLAVLLTIGVLNTYVAGASKLGAALGRDGSLPAWLARGSERGSVPGRSLTVIGVVSALGLLVLWMQVVPLELLVQLTTSAIVTVYLGGLAAAVRLLPGRSARVVAAVGLVLMAIVAASFGWLLLWPAGVGACALAWHGTARRFARRHAGVQRTSPK